MERRRQCFACDLFVLWNGNRYNVYKCFKERTKALPHHSRLLFFHNHEIERIWFGAGFVLLWVSCANLQTRYWQIELALCEACCQKDNEPVNKAFHSFSLWFWLGSLLWQKRNLLVFPHLAFFYLFRQSSRPSEGQWRRWAGFQLNTKDLLFWVEMELCNSDITCNTGDLVSRYMPDVRGGPTRFDSDHVFMDVDLLV